MEIMTIINDRRRAVNNRQSIQHSIDLWFSDSALELPVYHMFFGFFCLDGWEEY